MSIQARLETDAALLLKQIKDGSNISLTDREQVTALVERVFGEFYALKDRLVGLVVQNAAGA